MHASTLKRNKTSYSYPYFWLLFNYPLTYWQKDFLSYVIGHQFNKKCLMRKVVGKSYWIFTPFSVAPQVICCSWFLPPFQKSDRWERVFLQMPMHRPILCLVTVFLQSCMAQTTLLWNKVSRILRKKKIRSVFADAEFLFNYLAIS